MNRLIFIRHGATDGNIRKKYIGRTDEPLCERGIQQAEALRSQDLRADRLFISPMLRTRQTAEILFPDMDYTVVEDFRETDFGIFEGKTAAELSGDAAYQSWVKSWCRAAIPGGESVDHFKRRCRAAFCQVIKTVGEDETAAFVVHGGTIMAILEAYAQPQRDFYEYHIGNGEGVHCVFENGIIRADPCALRIIQRGK